MLQVLVDDGKHKGMGGSNSDLGSTGRQAHEDTGSQQKEQNGSCQNIRPHFY